MALQLPQPDCILLARELCEKDTDHWKMIREVVTFVCVEVAELLKVSDFLVKGTCDEQDITPGSYEAAFGIKIMEEETPKLDMMVKLKVTPPNQISVEHTIDLTSQKKNQWTEIKVTFPLEAPGKISFSMTKTDPNYWPVRIRFGGVVIRPSNTRG